MGAGLQTANLTTSPQPSSGAQVDVTAQDAVLLQLLFLTDLSLCLGEKKKKYGCVSALGAVTHGVISFSKTDFINIPLPTNIGKTKFVFFNGIGPGFVWISVCAGRDSLAALHW